MITKKIVWFFGPSCAGKKTTIEEIISFRPGLYSKILELPSLQTIKKCEESFVTSNSRGDLAVVIPKNYRPLRIDGLLVKGQTSDLDGTTPQRLKRELTNITHEVVFLWVAPKELNSRRLETRKGDPWDGWSIENHKNELKLQVEKVDKLKEDDFQVFWIDNTENRPKILIHDEAISRTKQLNESY